MKGLVKNDKTLVVDRNKAVRTRGGCVVCILSQAAGTKVGSDNESNSQLHAT